MIPALVEPAVRGLLLAAVVWAGLRAMRVRNVVAEKTAWGLVLVAALVLPAAVRWPGLLPNATVVLPARVWQAVAEILPQRVQPQTMTAGEPQAPARHPLKSQTPATPERTMPALEQPAPGLGRFPAPAITNMDVDTAPRKDLAPMGARPVRRVWDLLPVVRPSDLAWGFYLLVCVALLLRLIYGAMSAAMLWFSATPVRPESLPGWYSADAEGVRLRWSREISSPLTIGSGVLLPEDYAEWDARKVRIVLAHERSHVRQGDFYLQMLAGIYTAIFWFSPLGWWLKRKLSDLSETISDRAGLREAASRFSYAQILLEFAVAPRSTSEGVAMARPNHLTERIEKLLNESSFRQAFAGSRGRLLAAVLLVPTALVGATALVRVEAAAKAAPQPAAVAQPAAQPTVQASALAQPKFSAVQTIAVDATSTFEAAVSGLQSAPTAPLMMEAAAAPAPPMPAAEPMYAARSGGGDHEPAATFEKTLTVSGQPQLSVATGSGDITLKRGNGNQVHVLARIYVSHDGNVAEAKQIAANPPIEQNGNVIRIGQQHQEHWHGISIDYQIEAPAETQLNAATGSGDIADEGVGQNAKLTTGSGNIHANGLQGGFFITTGSGDVQLEETGAGDGKAQTGSGNIEIKGVHGGLYAMTGSGDIKATGTASSGWQLKTGSGDVELALGGGGFTLEASTGSGSINSDHEMAVQGDLNRHHITAKIGGGGPTVRVETGSGDIRVH